MTTTQQEAKIIRMYKKGISITQIGSLLKTSYDKVKKALNDNNIETKRIGHKWVEPRV